MKLRRRSKPVPASLHAYLNGPGCAEAASLNVPAPAAAQHEGRDDQRAAPFRPGRQGVDRRCFSSGAALFSAAALLSGCRSTTKPARDATLLHNKAVREAVTELERTMNAMDERLGQFNAENWQDALANLQTSTIRMQNSIDDLKRALGYAEPG